MNSTDRDKTKAGELIRQGGGRSVFDFDAAIDRIATALADARAEGDALTLAKLKPLWSALSPTGMKEPLNLDELISDLKQLAIPARRIAIVRAEVWKEMIDEMDRLATGTKATRDYALGFLKAKQMASHLCWNKLHEVAALERAAEGRNDE